MSARPQSTSPTNLLALDPGSLQHLVAELGWPRYRAHQILRWLYRRRIRDVEGMTDLSVTDRANLQAIACIERFTEVQVLRSDDGSRKFLARLHDGLEVESVLIPEGRRLTLCLSTQVGCTLDCGFCLTGQMGLQRNLKAHEIVDQVLTVQDQLEAGERLTNLVLMGMGEPLANLEAVKDAIQRLTDSSWGLEFPARRITLSTAGLAPRLKAVAPLGINLAVSLNATTNAQRDRLMPAVNQLYPLDQLLAACREFPLADRRRLTFEYVLLAGENDREADAKRLAHLLTGFRCKVNLIPFNEFPNSPFRRPKEASVLRFQAVLQRAGLQVFIRHSKGRDVLGACGQLGRLSSPPQSIQATRTLVGSSS
jgi:23S rRNA (adenine2503-C2)-methyltransferase